MFVPTHKIIFPLTRVVLGCLIYAGAIAGEEPLPFWFGDYQSSMDEVGRPLCVAITEDGRIYVTDADAGRVRRFASTTESLDTWRGVDQGKARFLEPHGIAVQGRRVFVTDSGRHAIVVLNHKGRIRGRWGGLGGKAGKFRGPTGIAADSSKVYVADTGNRRVQVFNHKGALIRLIEGPGGDAGSFSQPEALTLDEEGHLYIADRLRHRIYRYDEKGEYLNSWGDWGFHPGLFDEPVALAWQGGRLLVLERRNHRVQAMNGRGEVRALWGLHEVIPHEGGGKLHYPDALAVAPGGGFAIIGESIEGRLQVFAPAAPDAPVLTQPGEDPGRIRTHFGDSLSIDGPLMAMADPERLSIFIFDTRSEVPIIINRFGERGEGFGLLNHPSGLFLDLQDKALWVADTVTRRLQKFRISFDPRQAVRYNPNLSIFARAVDYARLEARAGPAPSWPLSVSAIRRDGNHQRYTLDAANATIRVFDDRWNAVRSWGGHGAGDARFDRPTDLSFSKDGQRVFVVDQLRGDVRAFDHNGKPLFSFAADDKNILDRPFGITSGRDGFVYVTDQSAHEILKFDEKGRFQGRWGGRGDDMGQLWHPTGIAMDMQGRIIVIDQGNHRAQIFQPDGTWLVTFGAGRAYTQKNRPRKRTKP